MRFSDLVIKRCLLYVSDLNPSLATSVPHPSDGVIDLVTGGWPCQDLSGTGKRAGLTGARSGLFCHVLRVADAYGATWVFLENAPQWWRNANHIGPPSRRQLIVF